MVRLSEMCKLHACSKTRICGANTFVTKIGRFALTVLTQESESSTICGEVCRSYLEQSNLARTLGLSY